MMRGASGRAYSTTYLQQPSIHLGEVLSTKCVIFLDDDINIYEVNEVEWSLITRVQPDRDAYRMIYRISSMCLASTFITLSAVSEVRGSDRLESIVVQGAFGEDSVK